MGSLTEDPFQHLVLKVSDSVQHQLLRFGRNDWTQCVDRFSTSFSIASESCLSPVSMASSLHAPRFKAERPRNAFIVPDLVASDVETFEEAIGWSLLSSVGAESPLITMEAPPVAAGGLMNESESIVSAATRQLAEWSRFNDDAMTRAFVGAKQVMLKFVRPARALPCDPFEHRWSPSVLRQQVSHLADKSSLFGVTGK